MEEQAPNQFSTLLECVKALEAQGYTDILSMRNATLNHGCRSLDPGDFRVDSYHRFEGPSDPADMGVVYAVSSEKHGLKGLVIGAYGSDTGDLVQKLLCDVQVTHYPWLHGLTRPVQSIPPGSNVKIG